MAIMTKLRFHNKQNLTYFLQTPTIISSSQEQSQVGVYEVR